MPALEKPGGPAGPGCPCSPGFPVPGFPGKPGGPGGPRGPGFPGGPGSPFRSIGSIGRGISERERKREKGSVINLATGTRPTTIPQEAESGLDSGLLEGPHTHPACPGLPSPRHLGKAEDWPAGGSSSNDQSQPSDHIPQTSHLPTPQVPFQTEGRSVMLNIWKESKIIKSGVGGLKGLEGANEVRRRGWVSGDIWAPRGGSTHPGTGPCPHGRGAHRPLEHGLHVLHRSVARCPTGTSSSGCSRPAP